MDAPFKINAIQEESGVPVIRVTWDSVTEACVYRVYRAESPYGPFSLLLETAENGYLDCNLLCSRTYYYYAVSVPANGEESIPTNIVSIQLREALQVSVGGASVSTMDLFWNTVPGASCYSIYRSLQYNGSYQLIGSKKENSFQDTGLCVNTVYYYRVIASNGVEGSGAGKTKSVALDATVTTGKSTSLLVEWTPVFGAKGYEIYRSAFSDGPFQRVSVVAGNEISYEDRDLNSNTVYWYRVVSSNGASGTANGKTAFEILKVEIVTAENGSLLVSWNSISGAGCYSVYRSELGGACELVSTQDSTVFRDEALKQHSTYYYRIVADNGSVGEGTATTKWKQYQIRYENLLGAYNPNPTVYQINSPAIVLKDPGSIPGYVFTGWFNQAEGGQKLVEIPQGTGGERFVFARWERNSVYYVIQYFGNDASGPLAEWIPFPVKTEAGQSFEISHAIPTRRGYQFAGWNTESNGSGTWYRPGELLDAITSELSLYAQWMIVPMQPCPPLCCWYCPTPYPGNKH